MQVPIKTKSGFGNYFDENYVAEETIEYAAGEAPVPPPTIDDTYMTVPPRIANEFLDKVVIDDNNTFVDIS